MWLAAIMWNNVAPSKCEGRLAVEMYVAACKRDRTIPPTRDYTSWLARKLSLLVVKDLRPGRCNEVCLSASGKRQGMDLLAANSNIKPQTVTAIVTSMNDKYVHIRSSYM